MATETKYIFVTGGVASSLGKGIISASLAKLLQARNYSVTIQKLDPYINVDPGTLNPFEHGECFVSLNLQVRRRYNECNIFFFVSRFVQFEYIKDIA